LLCLLALVPEVMWMGAADHVAITHYKTKTCVQPLLVRNLEAAPTSLLIKTVDYSCSSYFITQF